MGPVDVWAKLLGAGTGKRCGGCGSKAARGVRWSLALPLSAGIWRCEVGAGAGLPVE